MAIRLALRNDLPYLFAHDRHIAPEELEQSVNRGRVLLFELDGVPAGWLRWGLFWDLISFMNMLYFPEEYRARGYGSQIVHFWERQMRQMGYRQLMTSTQSDETAQHFYRKLGYRDCGSLLLPGEPLEIILIKELDAACPCSTDHALSGSQS